MKFSILLLSLTLSFATFAEELQLHFPRENGNLFLATTARESAKLLDQPTKEARGLEICKYYGYQNVVSVGSTFFAVEEIVLNEIVDGEIVSKKFKKDFSNLYSYDHAVIAKLVCSKDSHDESVSNNSVSNAGREIAIEKEDHHRYLKRFSSSASRQ
ncbi:MAG: hypothetical protein NDI69_17950 [Bacteriovoracaceae bacterium]|nr:hypothetical protein [Bacteriovoracaceae bacterium]